MSEKESHPVRNGIIATVVGGIMLSAIPPLREYALKVLGWIWSGVVWVWEALISGYSIPGWVLLILGLLSIIGVVNIYLAIRSGDEPEFMKYTEDFIYGAKWRWSWAGNTITNLWCFCPKRDAQLVYDDSSCRNILSDVRKTDFICERCGNKVIASISGGDKNYAIGAAEREILRRIRTNEHNSSKNSEAHKAIKALNGSELKGRSIKVNQAKPRGERSSRRPRY
ncbi:hypothetical protein ES702_05861 [subsurface metagenome]